MIPTTTVNIECVVGIPTFFNHKKVECQLLMRSIFSAVVNIRFTTRIKVCNKNVI